MDAGCPGWPGPVCPRNSTWACFPGSSELSLPSGTTKKIRDVEAGESVMTSDSAGRIRATRVLGFLRKNMATRANYLTITTEDGHRLSLSGTHVTFIFDDRDGDEGGYKDVMARDVRIGDEMFVQDDETGGVKKTAVVQIEVEELEGAYVPVTDHGTLLVDGVYSSCYTNTRHSLAHLALAPARWMPSLFLLTNKEEEGESGIASLAKLTGYYLHKMGMLDNFHSNTLQNIKEGDRVEMSELQGVCPPAGQFWSDNQSYDE